MKYPSYTIEALINEFSHLPGIGRKTAQRLAMHILRTNKEKALKLSKAISESKDRVDYCNLCQNMTDIDKNPCLICSSTKRSQAIICAVESPSDVLMIEQTGHYKGIYHVLHGVISPMEGIGPNNLKIKSLLERVRKYKNLSKTLEIIIALNPTVEGETTTLYLSKILKSLEVKVSRLARGIPIGSEIEFSDGATLTRAIEGRVVL